ncbi:unnamed protein product, partial [Brenthis ino]
MLERRIYRDDIDYTGSTDPRRHTVCQDNGKVKQVSFNVTGCREAIFVQAGVAAIRVGRLLSDYLLPAAPPRLSRSQLEINTEAVSTPTLASFD